MVYNTPPERHIAQVVEGLSNALTLWRENMSGSTSQAVLAALQAGQNGQTNQEIPGTPPRHTQNRGDHTRSQMPPPTPERPFFLSDSDVEELFSNKVLVSMNTQGEVVYVDPGIEEYWVRGVPEERQKYSSRKKKCQENGSWPEWVQKPGGTMGEETPLNDRGKKRPRSGEDNENLPFNAKRSSYEERVGYSTPEKLQPGGR